MKKASSMKKLLLIITVCTGLTVSCCSDFSRRSICFVSSESPQTGGWNVTLQITESSGVRNSVVFGESTNASDGLDSYDLALPPMPPQTPSILVWFDTSFPSPFNKLLTQYNHYPSLQSVWNLSILWFPAPEDNSTAILTIHWDVSHTRNSPYQSFLLFHNKTMVKDMLLNSSYSFSSDTTPIMFQIMCNDPSSASSHDTQPLLLITLGLLLVVIMIFAFTCVIYLRKKR